MNFEVTYGEIEILADVCMVVLILVFNALRIVQDYYTVKS